MGCENSAALLRHDDGLVTREVAGETLVVPTTGHLAQLHHVFVLNPVGAFIWERLDGTRSAQTVLEQLVAEFNVDFEQARADLEEFMAELIAYELAVAGATSKASGVEPAAGE